MIVAGVQRLESARQQEQKWFLQNNTAVSEKLKKCMIHFLEMERNTLITAMIEGMDEEEYKEIKARVDGTEK